MTIVTAEEVEGIHPLGEGVFSFPTASYRRWSSAFVGQPVGAVRALQANASASAMPGAQPDEAVRTPIGEGAPSKQPG
jgi:hypothetical protein